MGWGLASPEEEDTLRRLLPGVQDAGERRRIALDHQRKALKRAERMWLALNVPASPPPGLALYLFAGDAVETDAVMAVDTGRGTLTVIGRGPGDGTVLRSSALMDERLGRAWTPSLASPIAWDQVLFMFSSHLGMTKDPNFTDNILFFLLEQPR